MSAEWDEEELERLAGQVLALEITVRRGKRKLSACLPGLFTAPTAIVPM